MSYVIGIDPGMSGGIAFYHPKNLKVFPTPVIEVPYIKKGKKTTRKEMDLDEVVKIIMEIDNNYRDVISCAFLEHVTAGTKQGVTGMFRFGQNLGQWQGILIGMGIPTVLVRPQVWKRYHGLIKADKNASRDLAKKFFPLNQDSFRLVKHDGLAEAALIGKYGYEQSSINS